MGNVPYVAARRARFLANCGRVNIPWGTKLEAVDGFLYWGGRCLCAVTSQNAHEYFSINTDGNGLERGRLTASIIARLSKRDKAHLERWGRVWDNPKCQKYRREDSEDYWLWNHAFFEAPLEDLRYIAQLIGLEVVT